VLQMSRTKWRTGNSAIRFSTDDQNPLLYSAWKRLESLIRRHADRLIAGLIRLQLAWPGGELDHVEPGVTHAPFADNVIR
jgi:hypothetical protein